MQGGGASELADPQLHPAKQAVLESMGNHWTGLTVFVDHPEVAMDNNTAEQRSASWAGSGPERTTTEAVAVERATGRDALQPVPDVGLVEHQSARVAHGVPASMRLRAGGQAPKDVAPFLPWNMSEQQRKEWSLEKEKEREDSS